MFDYDVVCMEGRLIAGNIVMHLLPSGWEPRIPSTAVPPNDKLLNTEHGDIACLVGANHESTKTWKKDLRPWNGCLV
jgi:hypothetical protein